MGLPGAGKSSTISSFHSVLSDYFIEIAQASSSKKSFTTEINKYAINSSHSLVFWDIFGKSGDNYKDKLGPIIKGQINEGFKEGDSILSHHNLNSTINDRVHAVVIVVDATNIESKLALEDFEKLTNEIQTLGRIDFLENK